MELDLDQTKKPYISVRGLSLKTPMGTVYSGVNAEIEKGTVCALFGDAGCGKTALLLTLSGRMKMSSGEATVLGLELSSKYRVIRRSSAVSFIPGLNDVQPFLRVKNIMAAELSLVGKKGNKENTDAYLERCAFADKKDVRFDDLNAYDRAYFGIILALAADPDLLCVDDVQTELTQHQSIKLMGVLRAIAQATGTTVLVCCSEYEIARHADGIVVLGDGAEAQRQAVIRDAGPQAQCPVWGSGNGVPIGAELDKEQAAQPERVPSLAGGDAQ